MGDLSGVYYREVPGVDRPAFRYSIGIRLARINHDGSSAPTLPSPIAWGRVREGVRGRRPETDHRFTIHGSWERAENDTDGRGSFAAVEGSVSDRFQREKPWSRMKNKAACCLLINANT